MSVTDFKICGNCHWYRGGKNGGDECWRYPPEVVAAPLLRPTIAGAKPAIDWVVQAVRPPVRESNPACGEFRPASEVVN